MERLKPGSVPHFGELGVVTSLNRPGGNITGTSTFSVELGPKRLELLHEAVPATSFGALLNPTNPAFERDARGLQEAARTLGLQLHVVRASIEGEIDEAFTTLQRLQVGGLVIGRRPLFQ